MRLLVAEGSERAEDRASGGIDNATKNQPTNPPLANQTLAKHVIVYNGKGAAFAAQNSSLL